jgi:hypothetical protein
MKRNIIRCRATAVYSPVKPVIPGFFPTKCAINVVEDRRWVGGELRSYIERCATRTVAVKLDVDKYCRLRCWASIQAKVNSDSRADTNTNMRRS